MSWTAPLALFSVAGLGLAAAVYHGGSEPTASTKAAVSPVAEVVAPRASMPLSPIMPVVEQKPAAVEPSPVSTNAAEAKPTITPGERTQKSVAVSKPTKQQAQKNQTTKKKLASAKNTNGKTQQQEKTVKTASSKDSRKPARRDVEIITAIVK